MPGATPRQCLQSWSPGWGVTVYGRLSPAVTSSDELWAVGPPGYLLQRLTRTFSHSHGAQGSHAATPHPEDLEDEWEVI